MAFDYPASWAELTYPWQRRELLLYLQELSVPDPRSLWKAEVRKGLIAGVEQVTHFFFDDHDFNEADVGVSLFDRSEVALVQSVREALDRLVTKLPRGGDDDYVTDPLWPPVTSAAVAARDAMVRR